MAHVELELGDDFIKTRRYLSRLSDFKLDAALEAVAKDGVRSLEAATPKDTGHTAGSWYYRIKRQKGLFTIEWCNKHINDGVPIVLLIQHGHGTGTGGYVPGRDFINPTMRPVFDRILSEAVKAVRAL